jgi:hypothetical protein
MAVFPTVNFNSFGRCTLHRVEKLQAAGDNLGVALRDLVLGYLNATCATDEVVAVLGNEAFAKVPPPVA